MKKIIVVFLSICLALGSCAGAFAASKESIIRGGGSRADQGGASVDPQQGGASIDPRQGGASVDPRQGGASVKNRAAKKRASSDYANGISALLDDDNAYLAELLRALGITEDQLGMWLADAYENGLFSEGDDAKERFWLEKTADDVKEVSAKSQERILPWAKENAEEQLIHKEEGEIIQKEETPMTIASVEVLEMELREKVIEYAKTLYSQIADDEKLPVIPSAIFENKVDNTVASLQSERAVYGKNAEEIKKKINNIYRKLQQDEHPVISLALLWPVIFFMYFTCSIYKTFMMIDNALIGAKQHFKYKL